MIPPVSTRPVTASTGAAKPTPTPISRSPPTPDSATVSAVSRCAASSMDEGSPSIRSAPRVGHDPAGEIADRGAQVPMAELQADGERGVGGERDLQRRAALGAPFVGVLGLLLDDPGVLELGQQRRDRGARDAE